MEEDKRNIFKDLEAKWTQKLLKPGFNYTEADLPKVIVDEILKSIQSRVETLDWQGDTTSGSSYLNVYNGLLKLIDADVTVVSATPSTYNATNAIGGLDREVYVNYFLNKKI